jgi:hypothetical protein
MTELTEGQHKAEFIVSETEGTISRDTVTILHGQNLQAGHVLGKVSVGAATGAAAAGNVGNGTITDVSVGSGVKAGTYVIDCIEPAANGGTFAVEEPGGSIIGPLTDGATDFAAGDRFTVVVGGGSGKYKEYRSSNTDGSQTAVAVLLDAVDATAADKDGVIIARQAEVNAAELVWFTGATDAQKTAGANQLKNQTILVRAAI